LPAGRHGSLDRPRCAVPGVERTERGAHSGTQVRELRGLPLLDRAIGANPCHPAWFHAGHVIDHVSRGAYETALAETRAHLPFMSFWDDVMLAALLGKLGRSEEARLPVDRVIDHFEHPIDANGDLVAMRRIGYIDLASGGVIAVDMVHAVAFSDRKMDDRKMKELIMPGSDKARPGAATRKSFTGKPKATAELVVG